MTDLDMEAHQLTVQKIFPRLSETETTDNVLNMFKKVQTLLIKT